MSDEKDRGSGPVPVRDLMRTLSPEPEAEGDPGWERDERTFELDDATWIARAAGAGCYGTGEVGAARLLAVHFFAAEAQDRPVREALIPAGAFPHLGEEELRTLFDRATPIELEE